MGELRTDAPRALPGRPRILVVDDDPEMVRTFRDVLEMREWATAGALSGEEALLAVRDRMFDVVLMDIRMSGLNGVETLAALKRRHPHIPVILMTAYSAPELVERAQREGAVDVLDKPVPLERLIHTLGRVVAARGSILVLDHEPDFVERLCDALHSHGYQAYGATTLEEGVGHLRRHAPDVVLIDLRMDPTHPEEAVRTISRIAPRAQIILTSSDDDLLAAVGSALRPLGVVASFRKPFPPTDLMRTVQELSDAR